MHYLHEEFEAGPDQVVMVVLDNPANVMLLDPENFDRCRSGQRFRYRGGRAESSPMRIVPPQFGTWHVVVDLGGYPGTVEAELMVLDHAKATT